MTREIKFRVFNKRTNKMYSPFTFNDLYGYEGECNAVNVEPAGTEEFFSLVSHDSGARDGAIAFIYPQISGANGIEPELELMQFTGLHDKNGKEIYENDIVKDHDNGGVARVEYSAPEFIAMYKWDNCLWNALSLVQTVEVIGNVHQNPELLNEKEK